MIEPHHIEQAQNSRRRNLGALLCLGWMMTRCALIHLSAQPYGLESVSQAGPFLNGALPQAAPGISGDWSAVVAFTNLVFTNALGLAPVPGTKDLCVWEREGRAWTFENKPGASRKKLLLDIHDECQGWDDSGLLGLAFHPGFATNHFVFVYYTWVVPGTVTGNAVTRPDAVRPGAYHDRLSRFTIDASGAAIPGSELVLVDQSGNSVWHNGGGLFFHPSNGFLYWSDGDDADSRNTQVIDRNLFSGVFRIDVDERGGSISHPIRRQPADGVTAHYYIPNDNPFVGRPGALEEYFCLGLRNPHRMTCDPKTGRIFIGDVGESSREEIDVIEPGESGLNFQWSVIEGAQGDLKPPYIGISRGPLLDYSHSVGRAVIGGYVYRGKKFAADLGGKYLCGDNVMRVVWALDESATPHALSPLCVMPRGQGPNSGTDYTGLSSFGLDADGEIYMCQLSSIGGRIYQLARSGPPPPQRPVPLRLSQTGVFRDLASLTPSPGLLPYNVNSPLWSDGAVKARWIAVPAGGKIAFSPTGEWTFPAGTVFVKNFSLPLNETNPAILRRLETRLIVRDNEGFVYGASYRWRADLSDADLVPAGITENIPVVTSSGIRTQQWFYPGRQDCLRCHTPASGGVLGVKTRQINREFTYPETGVTDNQLRTWNHLGLFETSLDENDLPRFARLVAVTDTRASLEMRVRSYLDANCSNCHRPGGAHAFFDARFDTPLDRSGIVNGAVANTLGTRGARIIAPGNLSSSILLQRVSGNAAGKMPPLARNRVDTAAATAIAGWIQTLQPPARELPPPWRHEDVGIVGLQGEASYSNDRFSLVGAGADIWDRADAFHFAYRPLTGNGQITARVSAIQETDPWAKAGVMFRADSAVDSPYAAVLLTPANGATFQQRAAGGGVTANTAAPSAVSAPCWLRLSRAGNQFTGSVSRDGTHWTEISRATIAFPDKAWVGLAVTSHEKTRLNSTLFDHVEVQP